MRALTDQVVPDAFQLTDAVLLVGRVVGRRIPIQVAEPQAARDLQGVAPIRLLAARAQVQTARIDDHDVVAACPARIDKPAVQANCFDGEARRHPRFEASHERQAFLVRRDPGALFRDHRAFGIQHTNLNHGLVQIDSNEILGVGHGRLVLSVL